jgi:allantoinase
MSEQHELVVRAARALVDGRWISAEVGVRGGRVATVAGARAGLAGTRVLTLADDEVLVPGLVDTHVHVNEPGRTHWEGFASATRAAAAGGVTTIVDMPLNSVPPTVSVDALTTKRASAAPQAQVDVGFWGGVVPENLGALRPLHDAGVLGFKAFLAPSGVDEFGHLDGPGLDRALEEIAAFDGLLLVHAEDPGVLDAYAGAGSAGPAAPQDHARFVASRPDAAEVVAIERLVAGVRRTGARAHVLHLSSARALPVLRAARAEGLPITVETCPHYLTITSEQVPAGGTQFKCCPPIRDAANQDALWAALLDGDIDVVVTDHSPSTADLKLAGGGDFAQAWGGIAGLQTGLAAVWTAARERGIGLERVLAWMSTGPAALVGLDRKGRIAVGADADLVVLAPDAAFTVDARTLLHKNPVSAFDGRALTGVVRRTWLRGELVGTGPDDAAHGRLLTR